MGDIAQRLAVMKSDDVLLLQKGETIMKLA